MKTNHHLTRLRFLFSDASQNLKLLWRQNLLALLGISASSACFIATLNISGTTQQEINRIFTEMGPGKFVLDLTWDNNTYHQSQRIDQALAPFPQDKQLSVVPITTVNATIFHHGDSIPASLIATTPPAADTLDLVMTQGRFLHPVDATQKNVVLGAETAQSLNLKNTAALTGQYIRVDEHYFKIIGVLNSIPYSPLLSFDPNQSLFMHVGGLSRFPQQNGIKSLLGNASAPLDPEAIAQALAHSVGALSGVQDVEIKFPMQLVEGMKESQKQLSYFLFSVGVISLLLGSIGIMNVMLSNIRSRTKEIGLRLAVGAQFRDIRDLFLLESTLLTTLGASIGLVFSAVLTRAYALMTDTPFQLSVSYSLLGLLSTILVSMLFGLYPAIKASRLQPVEALKDE